MTFNDLAVGARFYFRHEYDVGRTWAYEWDWRVKTGPRSYERVWSDGSRTAGVVGVGDQPVSCKPDEGGQA